LFSNYLLNIIEKTSASSKGSLHVMQVHLDRQKSIAQFIKEFKNTYTSLDVLINNAAIVPQDRELRETLFLDLNLR
jgi:NADP-dependent 3-hydroxy acid dehydrogenase YdfG